MFPSTVPLSPATDVLDKAAPVPGHTPCSGLGIGSAITHDRAEQLILLADGTRIDISRLGFEALQQLQIDQEPAFAQAIATSPKDSVARERITGAAYSSICAILARMSKLTSAADFTMGMDQRYSDLVIRLLQQQTASGVEGGFFEVGFSSGTLLSHVADQGYDVGGVEVVADLCEQAKQRLESKHHAQLHVGDFRKADLSAQYERYSVVYWNDVFEHIPTDEILDYLEVIYNLLSPGGKLVTITPNWHMRPSDVTADFCPPRTEAIGFHLKEYTATEVCQLVKQAGFQGVETPAFITRKRIHTSKLLGLTAAKLMLEPLLEKLPYRAAVQVCRRFGLNCTIATK